MKKLERFENLIKISQNFEIEKNLIYLKRLKLCK